MRFISILLVISGLASAALSLAHDSVGQIKDDLKGMDTCTTALTESLGNLSNTYPTGDQLKVVLVASLNLKLAFAKCSNDTALITSALSFNDGFAIFSEIEDFEPHINTALSSIQLKKAAFGVLGQIPTVHEYLIGLEAQFVTLVALLIKICPKEIVPDANAFEGRILVHLKIAIDAFASM